MQKAFFIIIALLIIIISGCAKPVTREGDTLPELEPSPFYKWSSSEIVKAFSEKGLETVDIKTGFIVGVHRESENTVFMMPSFGRGVGGVVSGFNSEEALKEYVDYYSDINEDSEKTVWRIFRKDNIVVLISGKVPSEAALQYKQVLMEMGE